MLWRKREGFTLEQVGDSLDITGQTVSAIEKGRGCPSLRCAFKIEELAKIPAKSWLDTDTAPQPAAPTGDDDAQDGTTPG